MSNKVMVIDSRASYRAGCTPFPPIGAIGTIVEGVDKYNEVEIVFDKFPFPSHFEDSWTAHISMLVWIDDNNEKQVLAELEHEETY